MNRQEAFNKVSRALLLQNKKSLAETHASAGEQCCYVDKEGNKCAIGHLLPEHLTAAVKTSTVNDARLQSLAQFLKSYEPNNEISEFIIKEQRFCRNLQIVHDNSAVDNWRVALLEFAKFWSLETTTLGVSA